MSTSVRVNSCRRASSSGARMECLGGVDTSRLGVLELALGLGMHEEVQGHTGEVNGKVRRAAEVQVLLATLECFGINGAWHAGLLYCGSVAEACNGGVQ